MQTETIITPAPRPELDALAAFISQRSGIDFRDYGGSREAFMGDYRPMLLHGKDAREMLRAARLFSVDLARASERAFSGRLTIRRTERGAMCDYCTGQYFPTEYRAAACAVLAQAFWSYWRDECGCDTRAKILAAAKRTFSRGVYRRWFVNA